MRIEFLLAVANAKTSVSRRLVLAQDQCAIGRQDGDLRLSDTLISRMHAVIYFDAAGILKVKDLDSTNGTFVNDQRVSDHVLHKGDEIRVGDTSIVLVHAEPHQGRAEPSGTEAEAPAVEDDRQTENHEAPARREVSVTYLGGGPKKSSGLSKMDELTSDDE